ncbi:MAG TPA: pilus assembly protein TadG-related protein [Gaiellaceae bacterium]|nr:pilus assembly protein TadG-related protein [Gaiellaceae bacterium]
MVTVLVALLLPVLLAIGSIVVSIGNWYVHKRHLQTQVDAAALAAAREFTGCFVAPDAANQAIKSAALAYAGDTNRRPDTTNLQVQEPADVHVLLNSDGYWSSGDPVDDVTLSSPPYDGSLTTTGDPSPPPGDPSDPCETRTLDVKATDATVPDLWRWFSFSPNVRSKARVEIRKIHALAPTLPFAVPEVEPGAVAVILVDENAPDGSEVLAATEISHEPDATGPLSKFNVYDGLVGSVSLSGRDNVGLVVLVSDVTVPDPDLGGTSLAAICGQPLVRCYSGSSKQSGLALVHAYESGGGGGGPVLRQVSLGGCADAQVNLSGPYFPKTGDCVVSVTATIDFAGLPNPAARLHRNGGCQGNGDQMTGGGSGESAWTATATLPESSASVGQVRFSISWRTGGGGGWTCFPGVVARPYVANLKSGPVEYLKIDFARANAGTGPQFSNGYSLPKEPGLQPFVFMVTVGLRPPLEQSTLTDQPVLIRFATEDDPSLTQSIDCDVDSYTYPEPFDSMPKDSAEIGYGCVTPYSVNPTLDCSDWSNGELPPDPPPAVTEAPDCAQSKNGQVSSLRQGLSARFENPCTPNYWPDPPITSEKLEALMENFGTDPRLVVIIVTRFGAFSGTGSTIVPIKFFAGFYVTGWDYSQQTPGCPDPDGLGPLRGNDPHPLYGTAYQQNKPHLDDGDVWGYFVTPVVPASAGNASDELCAFDELGTCIAVLVE